VWLRDAIETPYKRLMRLEQHAQGDTIILSDAQIRLLEQHSVEFRCRHVESSSPGELLNQDTFYWGTLKGVGKVYVQVFVDVFARWPLPKSTPPRCPSRLRTCSTITCCRFRRDSRAILTDNGREFCCIQERHPYELLLAMEGIEHRTTNIKSPRTNGFVERMNRTPLDECFRVQGRQTWYIGSASPTSLNSFLHRRTLSRCQRLCDRVPEIRTCRGLYTRDSGRARK
jgi:transposase InsO family protein